MTTILKFYTLYTLQILSSHPLRRFESINQDIETCLTLPIDPARAVFSAAQHYACSESCNCLSCFTVAHLELHQQCAGVEPKELVGY